MSSQTEARSITTPDGPMQVYEAIPDSGVSGGVIVIPEAFGVTGYVQEVSRRLASEGYHAVAIDMCHRSGGGTIPYDAFKQIRPLFEGLSDDGVLHDIDAAIELLDHAGIGASRVGLLGFCIGGRMSYLGALHRHLGAAVGFYGAGIITPTPILPQFPSLAGQAQMLRTPWLGIFGDEDELIPAEDVEALGSELDAEAELTHDIVRYPGVGHGFHCDARPASYDAEAAADAWHRTLEWLERSLT